MEHKALIEKRFLRNLKYYDENALTQKEMAQYLTDQLFQLKGSAFPVIFEIGCGTGLLSKIIAQKCQYFQFIVNDLNQKYAEILKHNHIRASFLTGDAEMINFPVSNDLILSNAVFQWFDHLEAMLLKCREALKPGGILAFTTFGPGNYQEIDQSVGISLKYHQYEAILRLLSQNFKILFAEQQTLPLYFNQPLDVLRHIHKTGVNGNSHQIWTQKDFQKFTEEYQRFYIKNLGYSLTYEPFYFIAQRG